VARSKAPGRIKARDYLARAASSRALYALLVADALALLPPADPRRTEPERLESMTAITELAKKLGVSRTTAQAELRRLENFGWLEGARPRFLGHREGATLYLLADVKAQEETKETRLVSREVLRVVLETSDAPGTAAAPEPAPSTGLARKWRPPT
jgi:DNA-binding transcriptional MocR family regulator